MDELAHEVDERPALTAANTDPRIPVAVVSATVIVAGFVARAGVRMISGARTRRVLRTARHKLGL